MSLLTNKKLSTTFLDFHLNKKIIKYKVRKGFDKSK